MSNFRGSTGTTVLSVTTRVSLFVGTTNSSDVVSGIGGPTIENVPEAK